MKKRKERTFDKRSTQKYSNLLDTTFHIHSLDSYNDRFNGPNGQEF